MYLGLHNRSFTLSRSGTDVGCSCTPIIWSGRQQGETDRCAKDKLVAIKVDNNTILTLSKSSIAGLYGKTNEEDLK